MIEREWKLILVCGNEFIEEVLGSKLMDQSRHDQRRRKWGLVGLFEVYAHKITKSQALILLIPRRFLCIQS